MKPIFGKRQLFLAILLLIVGAWRLYEMRSTQPSGGATYEANEPSIETTTTAPTGQSTPSQTRASASLTPEEIQAGLERIEEAFYNRQSNVWLAAEGKVFKHLADDTKGSKHQKFLLEVESGRTLLFAHNIDLAPRIPVREGEMIRFRGEYEWNEQGGVVHWTHHDPQGRHEGGWIEYEGKVYK